MKVKELVEKLQGFDEDLEVCFYNDEMASNDDIYEVVKVEEKLGYGPRSKTRPIVLIK